MNSTPNRKLAAIMFTDIQGYTALMQHDEKKGVAMRERHREVFNSLTIKHGGTILQYYGDGTLSTFDSVVAATKCGIEMQREFSRKPVVPLRVGIHIGDIITTQEEVIGDAVNVASRIESLAIAGSILISDIVQKELYNQKDIQWKSMGFYEMKNVDHPMEIFAVSNKGLKIPSPDQISEKVKPYKEQDSTSSEKIESLDQEEGHRKITITGPSGGGTNQVEVSKKKKTWTYITSAAVIIGIIGSLTATINIIKDNFFSSASVSSSTQLTVYVHGPEGPQDIILENEGEVVIDFDGDRRTTVIGDQGRSVFTEIPEKFIGQPLHILVSSEGFEESDPEILYEWNENSIYVPMVPDKSLGKITGIVKSMDGSELLDNARVIIDNEFTTVTDNLGKFSLVIENNRIKDKYDISILKAGYRPVSEYYYPNSSKEFRLKKEVK
ncbi:MAG: adenylate/guanylate cyclase domain-containing protein [Saprospiraceae bacterium]|nr:adenylate/guanylate cyclase domain-containing protein [Saprospiraceae bacterium]